MRGGRSRARPTRIADFHVHIGTVRSWSKSIIGSIEATVGDLIAYMDCCDVEKAVVLPVAEHYLDIGERIDSTEAVLRATARHNDRLIPFCSVNPLDPHASEEVEEFVERGCRGFGEHKVELPVSHPKSKQIYALCGKLGIPVLVHMDNRFNPGLDEYERVVRDFPDVPFIAHGPNWWSAISSLVREGEVYPSGRITKPGQAVRILEGYSNAYADISATSGLNALERDTKFARKLIVDNCEKILYGTDYPCLHASGVQFGPGSLHLRLLKSLRLPEDVLDQVLWRNAERLLRGL